MAAGICFIRISVADCEHWKDKGVSGKDKQTSAFNNTDLGKSRIGREIGLERGFWENGGRKWRLKRLLRYWREKLPYR